MRPTRATVLLAAGLVTLLGVPAAAAAETPSILYVNNHDGSNCADGGPGSQAVPFCTISAAARGVEPGQTVRIKTGKSYAEAVTIDRSGEQGKPVAFVADGPAGSFVSLGSSKDLTISGASHVVVRGLTANGGITVSRSADVELDRIKAFRTSSPALVVGEASTDVRVSRATLYGARIEGGAQRTVLSRNEIHPVYNAAAVTAAAVDAPGPSSPTTRSSSAAPRPSRSAAARPAPRCSTTRSPSGTSPVRASRTRCAAASRCRRARRQAPVPTTT
ncbi:hypothetical protein WKI68_19590 [Streptomyces sp. MS1.HAVA.3]|uniref:Right handed beta helix domain-containing protein n=1 Tax=Streptomyces caledonius TaxID=3134107 RepID=A0ABU8U526_9ACTN